MVHVLDTPVNLDLPLGHHLHCLVAQVPLRLHPGKNGEVIDRFVGKSQMVVNELLAERELVEGESYIEHVRKGGFDLGNFFIAESLGAK